MWWWGCVCGVQRTDGLVACGDIRLVHVMLFFYCQPHCSTLAHLHRITEGGCGVIGGVMCDVRMGGWLVGTFVSSTSCCMPTIIRAAAH